MTPFPTNNVRAPVTALSAPRSNLVTNPVAKLAPAPATGPARAPDSPAAQVQGKLLDLAEMLSALRELQAQADPPDAQKKSLLLNKDSPLIPQNGSTQPGTNRLDNMLKYYGIVPANPSTQTQVRAAIDALENTRSEMVLGIGNGASNVDALLQDSNDDSISAVVREVQDKYQKPLLSYLTEGVAASALEKAQRSPATLLELIAKSPKAEGLVQALLKKLGGSDFPLTGLISPHVKVQLLIKAITLSLDPVQSRKPGHVAGFHLASSEHGNKGYAEIDTQFRQHLIAANNISSADADLAAYLFRPQFPADFAVRDIPTELRYQGSAVWVNFKHGVALTEAIEPGSSRSMSFQELVDLPGKFGEQATTSEQWALIAATRIPATLDWAALQGVIEQKEEYSQAEITKAVSAFDEHVSGLVEATAQLAVDVPMRKDYFEKMEKGTSRTEFLSLISPFFALYRHLNGEKIKPSDVIYQYPVYDEDRFKSAFDEYLTNAKSGYDKVVRNLLSELPTQDRVAIEQGATTVYALRVKPDSNDETEEQKKAAKTRPGFILKAEHEGQTNYYEINPVKGIARRRDDLKPVLEAYDPAEKSYDKDFISIEHTNDGVPSEELVVRNSRTGRAAFKKQWDAYKAGKGPRPKSFSIVVPQQLDHFSATGRVGNAAVPNTLESERSGAIAKSITEKLFYVDEDQLREWATSDPDRESSAQKNDENFWERMKGVAQFFIPFWSGIEDLVNGRTKDGIIGLIVDGLFTFAGPAGKLAAGSVRVLSNVGKLSMRALLPKFLPLIKQFGVSVAQNLNPLEPIMGSFNIKAGKGLKFLKGDIDNIQAGIAQFRRSSPFKQLPGKGRYDVTPKIPLTSRSLPEGGSVRVPEGISRDEVRVLNRQNHTDVVIGDDVFRYDPGKPDSLTKLGGPDHGGPLEGFATTCGGGGRRSKRDLNDLCYTKEIVPGGTAIFQDAQALDHRRLIPGPAQANRPRTVVHEHRLHRVNEAGKQELLPIATSQPVTYKPQTSGTVINEPDFGFDDFGPTRSLNNETVVVKMDAISDLSNDQRVVRGYKIEHDGRQYVVVEGDTGVHYYAELNATGKLDLYRLDRRHPVSRQFIETYDQYRDFHGFAAQKSPNNQLIVLPTMESLVKKIVAENPLSTAEVEHLAKVLKGLTPEKQREVLMSVYASGANPGKVVVAAKPVRLEPIKKPADFSQLQPADQNRLYAEGGRKAIDDQFQATGIRSANQQVPGQPGEQIRADAAAETVGWLYTRTNAPNYSEIVLKTGAGNCDQMAKVAVDTINASGGNARIAQVKGHTFGIVGGPPGYSKSKGFTGPEWADAWVVDPWAGITCKASDYPARFKARMQEWSQQGRLILISNGETPPRSVWSDPMEPRWIDATVNGEAQVF